MVARDQPALVLRHRLVAEGVDHHDAFVGRDDAAKPRAIAVDIMARDDLFELSGFRIFRLRCNGAI
jgi:hypothetical protein